MRHLLVFIGSYCQALIRRAIQVTHCSQHRVPKDSFRIDFNLAKRTKPKPIIVFLILCVLLLLLYIYIFIYIYIYIYTQLNTCIFVSKLYLL